MDLSILKSSHTQIFARAVARVAKLAQTKADRARPLPPTVKNIYQAVGASRVYGGETVQKAKPGWRRRRRAIFMRVSRARRYSDPALSSGERRLILMNRVDIAGIILVGDNRSMLSRIAPETIDCVVTSPPYWMLRDYGMPSQIGMETTPKAYIDTIVDVMAMVHATLTASGTVWLNLGDAYAKKAFDAPGFHAKAQDLFGLPWRIALALQDFGWYLRSDIIWNKPNAIPENVRNRPTKAHEYIFLLAKQPTYFFDQEAVRQPHVMKPQRRLTQRGGPRTQAMRADKKHLFKMREDIGVDGNPAGKNIRTVWDVPTKSFRGAHFATFPEALIEPCIKAGCPAGGIVLDPFFGAGTTGIVATKQGREFVGIELNEIYADLARDRIMKETGFTVSIAR